MLIYVPNVWSTPVCAPASAQPRPLLVVSLTANKVRCLAEKYALYKWHQWYIYNWGGIYNCGICSFNRLNHARYRVVPDAGAFPSSNSIIPIFDEMLDHGLDFCLLNGRDSC